MSQTGLIGRLDQTRGRQTVADLVESPTSTFRPGCVNPRHGPSVNWGIPTPTPSNLPASPAFCLKLTGGKPAWAGTSPRIWPLNAIASPPPCMGGIRPTLGMGPA